MAKIKVKFGENEIEIDSRDFYVDNQTLGDVIEDIAKHIPEPHVSVVYNTTTQHNPSFESLRTLDDVEVFEPEFNEPVPIHSTEIKNKLKFLQHNSFLDTPRTVTEIVEQLREYGWAASPLDVSKSLANMAINGEILKNSEENRNYYFIKKALLTT